MSTRAFIGIQVRGVVGAAALLLGVLAALALAPGASALSTTCTGQDLAITPDNTIAAERSLQCLVNVYREENGLGPVTRDADLELAARRHSADMVNRGFFDHQSPEGDFHDARALEAGYPSDEVDSGENLAALFPAGTPFELFTQWVRSSFAQREHVDPQMGNQRFRNHPRLAG